MARIAVVGAGIAGLATAVALQQRGHDVTIIEERTDTSSGAAISIWPNALAALDHIGLGDSVREAGGRVTAGAMRWRDGSWLRHPSPRRLVKALGEPLVVVHRSALTDPAEVLRNDLYDRDRARLWSRGPVLVVGDAAHPMRPHLGQGGCQGLEDAAILATFVDGAHNLSAAFSRFSAFRRRRVRALVRESAVIGRIVNLRPAFLSAAASRASVVMPEAMLTRHLATVAARSAFMLPFPRGDEFSVRYRKRPAG